MSRSWTLSEYAGLMRNAVSRACVMSPMHRLLTSQTSRCPVRALAMTDRATSTVMSSYTWRPAVSMASATVLPTAVALVERGCIWTSVNRCLLHKCVSFRITEFSGRRIDGRLMCARAPGCGGGATPAA